ncbi:HlyC/CorC family transporter [Bacillus sporothermodurans]|nr:HlyC/CorC family transporter [Heyndrickxia sporothermodurans]
MDDIFRLVLVFIIIALSAFFVASEFAIVKVRSTRIDQLVEEGNKKALAAKKILSNLDEYLSTVQLGITILSLVLGWIGEATVSKLLMPVFSFVHITGPSVHVISTILSFLLITFVHVVVGELAPKTVAIQKAESISLLTSRPLIFIHRILFPFVWLLNTSSRLVTRLFGLKEVNENELAHTEEELRIIVSESYKSGEINQSEFKYVNKIFEFDNRIAKEIMVPRTEISSLSKEDSLDALLQTIREERYTRYPVIDGDKDHIIGMVNAKEFLTDLLGDPDTKPTLNSYIRPIIRVIDTIPIQELLLMMQKERIHMAVLIDEYGGTSGLVTVEDILEEIVGEIRDEFDMDEVPLIRKVKENHYIIDSKVLVTEVNDLLGTHIDDEDTDTIGGWVLTENYEAKQGDVIEFENFDFTIKEMEDLHVKYVEVKKKPTQDVKLKKQLPITNSEAAL